MQQPTAIYRQFLREALRLTWQRKSLWVFGIFAALISTGGVMDIVAASLKKVQTAGTLLEGLAHSSFIGYELAGTYIRQMALLGSGRLTVIVTVATLVGILLIVVAVLAQGALILGLNASKPVTLYTLKLQAAEHFWALLIIGLLNKLASALAVLMLALPLFSFYIATSTNSAALFFLLAILLIPAQIAIHIIYQFTLLGILHHGLSVHAAIVQASRLFANHWLATLEYGIILFVLVLSALFAVIAFLFLLAVPYALLFTAALLSGSFLLVLMVNVLLSLALISLILVFIGATVTFQYSAWYEFYKHGLHRVHRKKIFSKILRLAYR